MPTAVELQAMDNERTPLLSQQQNASDAAVATTTTTTTTNQQQQQTQPPSSSSSSRRVALYRFLEAQTPAGLLYERFMIGLILVNVVAFIVGSLFVEQYNPAPWASRQSGICRNVCDALWFGNYRDNGLQSLGLGATSVLEIFTVMVFSVEYICRLVTADLEDPVRYKGLKGRLRFMTSSFSLVDLASIVPFYVDVFGRTDLAGTSFLRMFRLLRMMRVEGRYNLALSLMDDVYEQQKGILGTALFIGFTTWLTVSSLYYVTERRNLDMIYCPTCSGGDDVDTNLCTIGEWGHANCTLAGCPDKNNDNDYSSSSWYSHHACYNLYQSIPMASYYALLNLFGEFPLITQHSVAGKFVGAFTAVVAVAVFALPAGIIGNGFESVIEKKRKQQQENGFYNSNSNAPIVESGGLTPHFHATESTFRGRAYNFWHAQTEPGSRVMDHFINILVVSTAITFIIDTAVDLSPQMYVVVDSFELISVTIFTIEYCFRVYAAKEDPKYSHRGGRLLYMTTFSAIVELLSFAPYWIEVFMTGNVITPYSDSDNIWSNIVKSLRLLRILRFERYTHAFLTFDDVIARNLDIFAVTGFTVLLLWIFFAAFLYFTERDNPDSEMASNYNTVPNAMWVTLLNLSGESPLCEYSALGKVATGLLGICATGLFGIPIGVLGAGFEEIVEEENEDNREELEAPAQRRSTMQEGGSPFERACFNFANGVGSTAARIFETTVYVMILLVVAVGVWQTLPGHENDFHEIEWIAVILFTFEWLIRLIGAGADPEFTGNAFTCRLRFIFSFYSIIDLLAIIPFYVVLALPNSIVNEYDEYLRMLRIFRLLLLDKYFPSISLIDDVIRLKFNVLRVAVYAAATLWVLFSAALFLCEYRDSVNEIDPVPLYGCDSDCTMMDRFQSFLDSSFYTGVHLTGDYPIITYSWPARFFNFFMVIAAVGVVSVPSGLIASGFVEILQSKNKARRGEIPAGRAGDDWYEHRYRELEGTSPPPSRFGPKVDAWQVAVNEFLNGKEDENGHTQWTSLSYACRVFMFTVIISNVLAVVLESVPSIDQMVGNQAGNFFDVFEMFSVMVFATEYILRLFSAPKNREALYSTFVYATTFFGIVDFLSTAPWFIEQALIATGNLDGDNAKVFRIFRIFRILQLEDFVVAFSKLDNVFRASKDVLKATGLMALIIWVGCGALFYIFEQDNPNMRECDPSIPLHYSDNNNKKGAPGCYDFPSTAACNEFYPGLCSQSAFTNMPNTLFFTAVFLGGEWGLIDFTWPGRFVCIFLCVMGIGLYSIPVGTLFDSFGAVLGLEEDDDDEEEDGADEEIDGCDENVNGDKVVLKTE